jgi:hypothetical protein
MGNNACSWRAVKLILLPIFVLVGGGLLMFPGGLALRGYGRRRQNGVMSIEDAVDECRRQGLAGWELVTFAQQLVSSKFTIYSTRNLWDTPASAFARGMGYCTQYNLALKRILDRLGFETEAVFCLKVWVVDNPAWNMGHTWLRVKVDGEVRDVCAGRVENVPGRNNFVALKRVWRGSELVFFLSQVGMIFFMGSIEWRALLMGRDVPAWAFQIRQQD